MTPEQASFLVQQYAQLMQGEFPATCKVLAAVKDDTRDYKPDAKSRTAWELATHLATADIWFLDSVLAGKFAFDPEAAKKAEAQFTSVADVVGFYEKTFAEKLKAVQAMSDRRPHAHRRLLRDDGAARGDVPGLRQQPQHPSSRPARRLPAGRWARRCRRSTAAAPTSRCRGSNRGRGSRAAVGAYGRRRPDRLGAGRTQRKPMVGCAVSGAVKLRK